jgi:hypothetical protein
MTIDYETVATGASSTCEKNKCKNKEGVYKSAAGWYIGYSCEDCGPWSRESGYYSTREKAETAINSNAYGRI